jgi:hypothetical protein
VLKFSKFFQKKLFFGKAANSLNLFLLTLFAAQKLTTSSFLPSLRKRQKNDF